MDHKALISSLGAAERARLTTRSDLAGLYHLAGHGALVLLGATWIVLGWPLWQIILLPYGVVLVFLFTLEHEATHQTPFAKPWLNEGVGHVTGLLLLLPFQWFRLFHLAHHRHTNDPDQDPELMGPRPDTWARFFLYLSGGPYWLGMARTLWRAAWGGPFPPYLPARSHRRLGVEARVYLALYTLAGISLLWSPLVWWCWILPALLGQPALRLYLLAEHGCCPSVANMLENSRTTFTNRLVRFLAWNMPYHAEHHAYPQVPFHQLPALHRHSRAHLKSTADGYGQFARAFTSDLN